MKIGDVVQGVTIHAVIPWGNKQVGYGFDAYYDETLILSDVVVPALGGCLVNVLTLGLWR